MAFAADVHLRLVVESVHDFAIFALDPEGNVASWNRGAELIKGYSEAEILGKPYAVFFDAEDTAQQKPARLLERAVADGRVEDEGWRVRKDGSHFWANAVLTVVRDEHGKHVGFAKVTRDLTSKRQAEELVGQHRAEELTRLKELIRLQAELLAHSGEFPAIGAKIVKAALALTGASDALIDLPADETFGTRGPLGTLAGFDLARVLGRAQGRMFFTTDAENEDELDRAECRARAVRSIIAVPVRLRGDVLGTMFVSAPDAGAFESADVPIVEILSGAVSAALNQAVGTKEHRRLQERVLIGDRMASVGTMAAGVAHEINNPLAFAISNIEMIAESIAGLAGSSPSAFLREMRELVTDAREGCERVRRIVRDLKTFSRAEDAKKSTLDVRQIAELAIKMTFNEIRHRAMLVKEFGPVPAVHGDEARLGQAFVNLLVNAAQAIPEGNSVRNEIRLSTHTSTEGEAVIEIRDSGTGIAPELHLRVFHPFFTTKKVGEGTGLGLAITQSIVGEMGGRIELESHVGTGTLFRVILPGATDAQLDELLTGPSSSRRGEFGRVFVVDDDLIVGKSFGRVLRNHHVTVFSDARVAIERLRAGDTPDVILCDLMMPEMTGIDFYEELERSLPEYVERVVFLTGGAFTPAARAFLDKIPNQRLEKPVDNAQLRAVVSSVLATR